MTFNQFCHLVWAALKSNIFWNLRTCRHLLYLWGEVDCCPCPASLAELILHDSMASTRLLLDVLVHEDLLERPTPCFRLPRMTKKLGLGGSFGLVLDVSGQVYDTWLQRELGKMMEEHGRAPSFLWFLNVFKCLCSECSLEGCVAYDCSSQGMGWWHLWRTWRSRGTQLVGPIWLAVKWCVSQPIKWKPLLKSFLNILKLERSSHLIKAVMDFGGWPLTNRSFTDPQALPGWTAE